MVRFETISYPDAAVPSLEGKVAIITGANSGLGKINAKVLASHGCKVYIMSRNMEKIHEAIKGIQQEHQSAVLEGIQCDFTDMESVVNAAQTFKAKETRLDILILNAGVMALPFGQTKQGVDIQFQVNHLAQMLLLELMLETLKSTSKLPGSSGGRVVLVSSIAHEKFGSKKFTYKSLEVVNGANGGPWGFYGQSKLANIHCAQKYASLLSAENIFVNVYHPGMTKTGLWSGPGSGRSAIMRSLTNMAVSVMDKLLFISVEKGANPGNWLATSDDIVKQNVRGRYFGPGVKEEHPHKWGDDAEKSENLYSMSMDVLKKGGFL